MTNEEKLKEALDWADMLAECLTIMSAQHGGRTAARLLRDFRDVRKNLAPDEKVKGEK